MRREKTNKRLGGWNKRYLLCRLTETATELPRGVDVQPVIDVLLKIFVDVAIVNVSDEKLCTQM